METHLEALLLYGGYSVWPRDALEAEGMELPDPPASLEPGGVVTLGEATFVLCKGGETGSAGDVRLEVSDVVGATRSTPGRRSVGFEVSTTLGDVSFVSFDLEVMGTIHTGPGRFRFELEMVARDAAVGGIETHRITLVRHR